MQQLSNKIKIIWRIQPFLGAIIAMIFCLFLWFNHFTHPWCEQIDKQFFLTFNKTLACSVYWQQLCGYLNHTAESWLNIVVMVGINFLAVVVLPKEHQKQALIFVIYCWILFQLGLLISHEIFRDWLAIERASPSLIISHFIKLSEVVTYPVKDHSANSFPAGHTFVLIYWAGFTVKYATKKFRLLTYLVTIILIFPRLISGAHWLTDVIFTMILSYIWLSLVIENPLYYYIEARWELQKYLEKQ